MSQCASLLIDSDKQQTSTNQRQYVSTIRTWILKICLEQQGSIDNFLTSVHLRTTASWLRSQTKPKRSTAPANCANHPAAHDGRWKPQVVNSCGKGFTVHQSQHVKIANKQVNHDRIMVQSCISPVVSGANGAMLGVVCMFWAHLTLARHETGSQDTRPDHYSHYIYINGCFDDCVANVGCSYTACIILAWRGSPNELSRKTLRELSSLCLKRRSQGSLEKRNERQQSQVSEHDQGDCSLALWSKDKYLVICTRI